MGKIKENWIVIIFTMIVSLTGSLILSSATKKVDKIDKAASETFVKEQDAIVKEHSDTQDALLWRGVDEVKTEHREDMKEFRDMWTKSIERQDKFIERQDRINDRIDKHIDR